MIKEAMLKAASLRTLRAIVNDLNLTNVNKRTRAAMLSALIQNREVTISVIGRFWGEAELRAFASACGLADDLDMADFLQTLAALEHTHSIACNETGQEEANDNTELHCTKQTEVKTEQRRKKCGKHRCNDQTYDTNTTDTPAEIAASDCDTQWQHIQDTAQNEATSDLHTLQPQEQKHASAGDREPDLPDSEQLPEVFVAIDFETADTDRDSACAVALVRVERGQITSKVARLIRPPRSYIYFANLHGITWNMLRTQPTFAQVWPELLPILEGACYLVAHNAPFDRSVLRACCEAAELPMPDIDFLCTMRLARQQWNLTPTALPNVCKYLNIQLVHHDPLSDALASAEIVLAAYRERQGQPAVRADEQPDAPSLSTAPSEIVCEQSVEKSDSAFEGQTTTADSSTTNQVTAVRLGRRQSPHAAELSQIWQARDRDGFSVDTEISAISNEAKVVAKAEAKVVTKAEAKVVAKAEAKVVAKAEAKVVAKAEAKVVAKAEAKVVAKAEAELEPVLPQVEDRGERPDYRYAISPSRMAHFFFQDCERYLRYHATPKFYRPEEGIPEIPYEYNPIMTTLVERGYEWEERCLRLLIGQQKVYISEGDGPLRERAFKARETIELLAHISAGEAIYQPTLIIPKPFVDRYSLDHNEVEFPACRPDLLIAEPGNDGPKIKVIDMKASDALRTSHRIQAALYSLILRDIVRQEGLSIEVDMRDAGIWLFDKTEPEFFDMGMSCSMLDTFLRDRLTKILRMPAHLVSWHLNYRCELCEFFVHCRQEAEARQDVSLLPFLSTGGRQFLREGCAVDTLPELDAFLQREDVAKVLDVSGSLRGQEQRLQRSLQALQSQRVVPYGANSLSFPISEQVRIVLTLQSDPLSGKIYAAGFRRAMGKDIYGTGSSQVCFVANTPEQCEQLRSDFLQSLFAELQILHDFNKELNWKDQKSLQCYVFDIYERELFNTMLLDALRDPQIAPLALSMLFYFQSENLIEAQKHPDADIPYPIVTVTEAIRELLALPAPIVIRLQEALNALPNPKFAYQYTGNELLCFELSNALKSDAIYLAWEKGKLEAIEWIDKELKKRLTAVVSVIDGLREQAKSYLLNWPPKFALPNVMTYEHEALSRLAFISRYESFMGAWEIRSSRTRPYQERLQAGISIPLRHLGGKRWAVLSTLDTIAIKTDDGLFHRLLVPDDRTGDQAQMAYDDYRQRQAWGPPKGPIRFASLLNMIEEPTTGLVRELILDVKYHSTQKPFAEGDRAVLHPRYTDYISHHILDRLAEIDALEDGDFLTLLRNSKALSSEITQPTQLIDAAMTEADKVGFTHSQLLAFKQCLHRRLTLVWGPPGTGKTHFLAQSICCLIAAKHRCQQTIRIAVTAFTHAAVENLLRELQEVITKQQTLDNTAVYKLGKIQTARGEDLKHIDEREAATIKFNGSVVLGGTVFGFRKATKQGLTPCDVLIIDEGSQLKLGETALVSKLLAPEGRWIIAGDDLQLPPIIQGIYPEAEDNLPGLHDSVFAYLRQRDDANTPYTCQLHENWRMNNTLSRFSAETLYGLSYRPANSAIAARKLRFGKQTHLIQTLSDSESEFLQWLLDPDWPLVVCILEDTKSAIENPLEAELIARLSAILRHQLLEDQNLYPHTAEGDRLFWRKALCIVSPHHLQIRAIQRALHNNHPWLSTPFVDTVDKMQGQQTEVVFVSYGVSDSETAFAEADFIYSLNRLNVSVTRARSKCLVCLPRPLLNSSFQLLSKKSATLGLGHMHALIEFCRRHGQQRQTHIHAASCAQNQSLVTAVRCHTLED